MFISVDPMFALNETVTDEELTEAYIDFWEIVVMQIVQPNGIAQN